MAKIIRCPNCGENVEIPPNPTGQIVTCIACGTAMRLKSKKDTARPKSDPSGSSLGGSSVGGSMSGSMTATRITSDAMEASGDEPPSLGATCDVCGKPVDPDELTEDRGRLACRDCIKGARSSRPRTKHFADDELIPFAGPSSGGVRRGKPITFGIPFVAGCAALVLYVACDLYLALNPKPAGTALAKTDEPLPSADTPWDVQNRATIEQLLTEARSLNASPTGQPEALQKYESIVAMAKGQSIGSQEVRALIDEAEREVEALRAAGAPASPDATAAATPTPTPTPGGPAGPSEPAVAAVPANVVPDNVPPQPNSLFDDPEVEVTDRLNTGLTSLESALAASGPAAQAAAKDAQVKFSEARGLLIREKRNFPEDPGWTFSNHGTAVAYLLVGDYPNALLYLDRLPTPPDRAALLNRVVTLLQMRENKAEAIQLLITHLSTESNADDGYALNLLGTTLARYPEEVIKQDKSLSDARDTYNELVKKLADRHPGERRWGARWIGVREWETKDKERRILNNRIEDHEKALVKVRVRLSNLKDQVDRGTATARGRDQYNADLAEEARLTQLIEADRAKLPPEEWLTPEQIVPVLPDVSAVNARSRGGSTSGAGATTSTKPAAE